MGYEHYSLRRTTLRLVLLISIISCSCVIVAFSLSYFHQIRAENAEKADPVYVDFKIQTTHQLMVFDLPSKQTINENKNPQVNNVIAQLILEADSYLSKKVSQ